MVAASHLPQIDIDPQARDQPGIERLSESLARELQQHLVQLELPECRLAMRIVDCEYRRAELSWATRLEVELTAVAKGQRIQATFRSSPSSVATEFGSLDDAQAYLDNRQEADHQRRLDQLPVAEIPGDAADELMAEVRAYLADNIENPSSPRLARWRRLGLLMWPLLVLAVAISFVAMGVAFGDWGVAGISSLVSAVPWFGVLFAGRAALMPAEFYEDEPRGRRIRAKIMESASGPAVRRVCIGVMIGMLVVLALFWFVCIATISSR